MRKPAIVVLLLGGVLGILVVLLASWSGPRPPVLVVTFQGHTNLHDGSRAVALCLSNCTRRVVDRQSNYELVFRNQGEYSTAPANFSRNRLLSAGEAEMLVIPVPPGSGSWCARFVFRHIPGGLEERLIRLQRRAEDWGLPIRYRENMYPVESAWMER